MPKLFIISKSNGFHDIFSLSPIWSMSFQARMYVDMWQMLKLGNLVGPYANMNLSDASSPNNYMCIQ